MSLKITQEYMDEYVVEPMKEMQKKIDEMERQIGLTVSNSAHIVREFDKVIKKLKE